MAKIPRDRRLHRGFFTAAFFFAALSADLVVSAFFVAPLSVDLVASAFFVAAYIDSGWSTRSSTRKGRLLLPP